MLNTLYLLSKNKLTPKPSIAKPPHIYQLNESVVWDREKKLLTGDGVTISLSKYEIYLMDILSLKFEQVCSNDEIINHFYIQGADINYENIKSMMMRLRKKLPNNVITSIYGIGYRLSSVL